MINYFNQKKMEMDALQREERRLRIYREADRYFHGQGKVILPPKFSVSMRARYPKLKANYCKTIVNAMVSKLKVTNVRCEDKQTGDYLQNIWRASKMDARNIKNIRQAVKRGDSFLLVWPDVKTKTSQIHVLDAETCFPFYLDDEGTLLYFKRQFIGFNLKGEPAAFKFIYYHDRLEKFYSPVSVAIMNSGSRVESLSLTNWLPYEEDGFSSVVRHPYGIPIVHFVNNQDESPFGESEISNVLGLNDAINAQLINLMRVGEFCGAKQGIISGVSSGDFPQTSDGKPRIDMNAGDFMAFQNHEAKAWQLDQSTPTGILDIIHELIDLIAQTSRTPKSILEMSDSGVASGFALSKVEGPMISKCSEAQVVFGSSYEEVFQIILKQAAILRVPNLKDVDAYAEWSPLTEETPQDLLTKAQTLDVYKNMGAISKGYVQRDLGLTEEEIAKINLESASEGESDLDRILAGLNDDLGDGGDDGNAE